MKFDFRAGINVLPLFIHLALISVSGTEFNSNYSPKLWKCLYLPSFTCPNADVKFYIYSRGRKVNKINPVTTLDEYGWDPNKTNVIIIHGFNGTEQQDRFMVTLRNAYLKRGDFNVFMVDWHNLAPYPCYLTSMMFTLIVSRCTAQLYERIIDSGTTPSNIHCTGHSLGAHICGQMTNYLREKQHKIFGLDPALPIMSLLPYYYQLTTDKAEFVEVIHTNSGILGNYPQSGHVDFSINGGTMQETCMTSQTNTLDQIRCSHYKSICYFAITVLKRKNIFWGVPCTGTCDEMNSKSLNIQDLRPMGLDTPEWVRGMYYVPYDDPDTICRYDGSV